MTEEIVRTQKTMAVPHEVCTCQASAAHACPIHTPVALASEPVSPWPPVGAVLATLYPATLVHAGQTLGKVFVFVHEHGILAFSRNKKRNEPKTIFLAYYSVGVPVKLNAYTWELGEMRVQREGGCGCSDPLKAFNWSQARVMIDDQREQTFGGAKQL